MALVAAKQLLSLVQDQHLNMENIIEKTNYIISCLQKAEDKTIICIVEEK